MNLDIFKILLTLVFVLFYPIVLNAQTEEWKFMHQGNRSFEAQDYDDAELYYLKALQENPTSSKAFFNLGDVQLAKNNPQSAYDYFEKSIKLEQDTLIKSMAYHNQGYIYHASAMAATKEEQRQQFLQKAIERYKHSLRLNPSDDDTRYNLALCQKLLKNSDQQSNQQEQQKQKQNENQQQDNKDQQQEEQRQEEKQQNVQLMNLSKQAEKQTKEKVERAMQNPRKKRLEKNW